MPGDETALLLCKPEEGSYLRHHGASVAFGNLQDGGTGKVLPVPVPVPRIRAVLRARMTAGPCLAGRTMPDISAHLSGAPKTKFVTIAKVRGSRGVQSPSFIGFSLGESSPPVESYGLYMYNVRDVRVQSRGDGAADASTRFGVSGSKCISNPPNWPLELGPAAWIGVGRGTAWASERWGGGLSPRSTMLLFIEHCRRDVASHTVWPPTDPLSICWPLDTSRRRRVPQHQVAPLCPPMLLRIAAARRHASRASLRGPSRRGLPARVSGRPPFTNPDHPVTTALSAPSTRLLTHARTRHGLSAARKRVARHRACAVPRWRKSATPAH
eukprot:353872-Chlamydomonas_euryale.AAC.9